MHEIILEMRGIGGPEVRDCLAELGGKQCTPQRLRGKGWTAVLQDEAVEVGPFRVDRVLLHVLGAPGPVTRVVDHLHGLAEL